MASTNTAETMFQLALGRGGIGLYIPNADIGSLAAGNFVSVAWLRRASYGVDRFRNPPLGPTTIYRPGNATGVADYYRDAGDLTASSGTLANDANWADTTLGTENIYLVFHDVHPQWIIDGANRWARKQHFPNMEPLSIKPAGTALADAGMQSSATSQYTESDADGGAATTFTKVTTANSENVHRGIGSGRVQNAGAGGYIRKRYNLTEGEHFYFHTVSRLDSGTNVQAVLQDVTGAAAIGSTVTHSQEAFQWISRYETVPTGSKIVEARIGGEGAADDLYVNAFSILPIDHARIELDTTWEQTEQRVLDLVSFIPRGRSFSSLVNAAAGYEMVTIPNQDYFFESEPTGANPAAVVFRNNSQHHWFQYPVYIRGRRAYSDIDTAATAALTQTSSMDLDLWSWGTLAEFFADSRAENVPNLAAKLAVATSKANALASQEFTVETIPEYVHTWGGSLRI